MASSEFLFFSGIRGYDPKTHRFSSDTREQATAAFTNIRSILEALGLTLRDVVKVTMFLNDLAYRDPIHEVWKQVFPEDVPARTALQPAEPVGGGAQFTLDVVACATPIGDRRTIEGPDDGPRHIYGMVTGVKARDYIFFSAIRGRNPRTKEFSDDTAEQARQALENLRTYLEHNRLTLGHVVDVTMYLNDLAYCDSIDAVWTQYFPENPPAPTALRVANAAASPRANAHFVFDVIARAE